MTEYIQKFAGEDKNYTLDWSTKGLGTDTASTATFAAQLSGISITNVTTTSPSFSNCTVSGGTNGITYPILATLNTAAGQVFQETIYCFVEP